MSGTENGESLNEDSGKRKRIDFSIESNMPLVEKKTKKKHKKKVVEIMQSIKDKSEWSMQT